MVEKRKQQTAGEALHDLFREIFELHAALSKIMDKVHAKAGLSTSQLKIMRALARAGPTTVPDMAALLGVSRQFVQTVCNDLLARKFIEFSDNPRHKRSRIAALTEPGDIALLKARQKENSMIEQALPEIGSAEATNACQLLKRIKESIQDTSNKAMP